MEEDRIVGKRKNIAARIGELVRERGLSQRAFGKLIGMQESYVSKILSGDANLTLSTIFAIEDVLNATVIEVRRERLPSRPQVKSESEEARIYEANTYTYAMAA